MNQYIIIGVGVAIIIAILYLLIVFCDNFRKHAYKLFLYAEHNFITEARMDYVVMEIYDMLPLPFKILPMEFYRFILQKMFDEIKDLLDDGKSNKSTRKKK